jgi:hypothetical protein
MHILIYSYALCDIKSRLFFFCSGLAAKFTGFSIYLLDSFYKCFTLSTVIYLRHSINILKLTFGYTAEAEV